MSSTSIKKSIALVENEIKHKELFTSPSYQNRLYKLCLNAAQAVGYKGSFSLNLIYDLKSDDVAYTDGKTIVVNVANNLGKRLKRQPQLFHLYIVGLIAHELGHIFYTDFADGKRYNKALMRGEIYPEVPDRPNADKFQEALKEKKNRTLLTDVTHNIDNLLEDIFVNALQRKMFAGSFKKGIDIGNQLIAESSPNVEQQKNKGYKDFVIIFNTMITKLKTGYCYYGDYESEYKDKVNNLFRVCKKNIFSPQHKKRCETVNMVVCELWDEIAELLKDVKESKGSSEGSGEPSESSGTSELSEGSSSGESSEETGSSGSSDELSEEERELLDEILSTLQGKTGDTKHSEETEKHTLSDKEKAELSEDLSFEGCEDKKIPNPKRLPTTTGEAIKATGTGVVEYDDCYTPDEDILRKTLSEIATDKVIKESEKAISKELAQTVDDISFPDIHKYCNISIKRIKKISPYLKSTYDILYKQVEPVVNDMVKAINRALKQERLTGEKKNLFYGKKLNTRRLYAPDLRVYKDNKLPERTIDLAVSILIDESGSMWGKNIELSRLTAIMFQAVCERLAIPVEIFGHTEKYSNAEVNLHCYSTFDCVDGNDKYRLADITARENNRDGCALLYVSERLAKRQEQKKLLLVISDGQPEAYSYRGERAKSDIKHIKNQAKRKHDISVIAAAIDMDKDYIKAIYGDSFLSIDKLDEMPKTFSQILKKNILN